MIHWLWGLLNTPKLQTTVLQELELTAVVMAGIVVVAALWFIVKDLKR